MLVKTDKACALDWCVAIPDGSNSHCKFHGMHLWKTASDGRPERPTPPPVSRELELRFDAEVLGDAKAAAKLRKDYE